MNVLLLYFKFTVILQVHSHMFEILLLDFDEIWF